MEIEIKLNSCRVCLKNVGVIPFFNDEGDGIAAELISTLFNISVVCYPNLPDTICASCMDNLKKAAAIKEAIINSEDVLNSLLKLVIGPAKIEFKEECEIEQSTNTNFQDTSQLGTLNVGHVNSETLDNSLANRLILSTPSEHKFELDEKYLSSEIPLPPPVSVDFSLSHFNIYHCWSESCDFRTVMYKRLIYHLRTHAEIKMYECEDCGEEFKLRSMYRKHVAGHRPERLYECHQCNKKFKRQVNLRQHIFIHNTEPIFKCQHCEKSFHNMKALNLHLLMHGKPTFIKNVVCEICHKTFKHSRYLANHRLNIHGLSASSVKKTFPASKHKRVPCEFCDKVFSIKNIRPHVKAVHYKEKPHKCVLCDKSFSTAGNLSTHMHFHSNSKYVSLDPKISDLYLKYKCDECDKRFSNTTFLKKHKVLHSGVKEHVCPHPHCGKEFALKMYLTRHVKLVHTTAEVHTRADPRNCNNCGKIVADMLQDTEGTLVHCKICRYKFRKETLTSAISYNGNDHILEKNPPPAGHKRKSYYLSCKRCYTNQRNKQTCYRCQACPHKPALCLECFAVYHIETRESIENATRGKN